MHLEIFQGDRYYIYHTRRKEGVRVNHKACGLPNHQEGTSSSPRVCLLLSPVQLFATLWTVTHQAALSMGFPRQEYWSGLPCLPPRDLPNPGIKRRSPTLQVDSLPAEPQGKPKNTRIGSPSFLQGIFLTQELNWGLLHCRQILYHLRYQGSPNNKGSIS